MSSQKPLVSVILVSYNTQDITLRCLSALTASQGLTPAELEIILVDNHSSDQTVKAVKANFPSVLISTSSQNLGFGAGNNRGLKLARGEYVLLLNTDAFLEPSTLINLISALRADPTLLSVAPKLRYENGSFQQSAGNFPTLTRLVGWMWWLDRLPLLRSFLPSPYHLASPSAYARDFSPDWLMGACVLFRRVELLSVGGFDPSIFMYAEEVELFYRLRRALPHKRPLLLSSQRATHLGSVSTNKSSTSRLTAEFDGLILFYKKHFPTQVQSLRFVLATGILLRLLVFSLVPPKWGSLRAYLSYFYRMLVGRVE